MQDDLDDAVDWAVAHKITTKDKVAIFGGSYGGYAVLAGMTFTPDRYACGVDMYGISNMDTDPGHPAALLGIPAQAVLPADGRPDDGGGQGAPEGPFAAVQG